MDVTLQILRFNPELDREPHWEEYSVEAEPTDRVLDLLHQVKWYQDGTLTFRRSCAHGVCGSDAMLINGRNRLACEFLVRDAGTRITVEPIRGMGIVKDLLVDMEPFWDSFRQVMPYLVNEDVPADGKERRQSQAERDRFEDTSRCILCAACTTSCPVFWSDQQYVGPAAIVNAHRFIVDSRDQAHTERLQIMADPDGVWRCRTTFNCVEACPRDIKITRAILEVTNEARSAGIT
jgi:succinate dehydrogenase / fumarate reductase iron-sulfur subunit